LAEFLSATPTAELIPNAGGIQDDEVEMGLTYEELSVLGRLRKEEKMGAYAMFERLVHTWKDRYTKQEISQKVKHFIAMNALNRHKMTTLTPSYHASDYSCEDMRFDHRPWNYPSPWDNVPFKMIDDLLARLEAADADKKAG
jgi:NAD+ synthase (glutamine-hydrolysing)